MARSLIHSGFWILTPEFCFSVYEVGCLLFAKKITACLLRHKPCSFQFKVGALNLAFVNGEFLCERGGGWERFAGYELFVSDLRFYLLKNLRVDWSFDGAVAELYV